MDTHLQGELGENACLATLNHDAIRNTGAWPAAETQEDMILHADWYVNLVTDCRRIIADARSDFIKQAQIQILEVYHSLGARIKDSVLGRGRPRVGAGGRTLRDLASDLGVSDWTLHVSMEFARRYTTVQAYLAKVPSLRAARAGKNSDAVSNFSHIEPVPSWHETVQLLYARDRRVLAEDYDLAQAIPVAFSIDAQPLSTSVIPYNVWRLSPIRPRGYGSSKFRGNTPPEVLVQCILRYTRPDNLVLDCMAGHGTTVDVCRFLGRRIIASDIKSWREDIVPADAETVKLDGPVDFVFMHVPYLGTYRYTDEPADLSGMGLAQFEEKLDRIIAHVTEALKPKKFLAILVGDVRDSGLVDLSGRVSAIGQRHLNLWDKVIVETTNPGAHASAAHGGMGILLERARRGNYLLRTCDTLLVFRKEAR